MERGKDGAEIDGCEGLDYNETTANKKF
jgi:hypothetical protein